MTMHTTSLPIQVAPSGPAQNLRANATLPNDGVNFGAALTRQIEQRQLEQRQALAQPQPNMAPPQAVAGPKPQSAAKPAANEARAPAREAVKEPVKEPAQETAQADEADAPHTPAAEEKAVAAEGGGSEEAATAAEAKVADAVVDMLAMVASFNQQQTAASPAPAATAAAQPGALLKALEGKLGDGTEAAVQRDGDALAGGTALPANGKAEPGIDLRALGMDKADKAGKAGDAAPLSARAGDVAGSLRDAAAHTASKEPAPQPLASIAAQATALQTAQANGGVPTDRLSARVGTPAWDNQVGQKVIWMVGGADQSATLELNPPDLGPVQVVLNVSNDMASVTFSSQQLEVRQALENALPRLREMMNESGIALGNASVNAGAEGRQGQDGNGSGRRGGGHGGNGNGGDSAVADAAPRQRTSVLGGAGAVDTFA